MDITKITQPLRQAATARSNRGWEKPDRRMNQPAATVVQTTTK
jgi:hypothetical protein